MITKKAYAKINIMLNVLHQREDHMHEVDMILTPLMLHDILHFELLPNTQEIYLDAPSDIGTIEDNLIYRAAKEMQAYFKIKQGAKIKLEKKIPIAAGLAGGSSDAAATLQGLAELWEINTSNKELETLAIKLGSDVPYCLYHQTMRAQGVGEKLTKIPSMPSTKVILLKPEYGISTKSAYEALHQFPMLQGNMQQMIAALETQSYETICQTVFNTFENVTYQQHPDLGKHKENIKPFVDAVLLSGSGPTLFALVQDEIKVEQIRAYSMQNKLTLFETETKI